MSVYDLARPEIRDLVPYSTPGMPPGSTRLNANEATCSPYPSDSGIAQNRYPEMRPNALRNALAALYDVEVDNLCPVRGSSEGIDLLIRAFCRAYRDNIVVLPPAFEMYSAYAAMQAAEIRCAPLSRDNGFAVDWQAVEQQLDQNTRIVFLCSPNNPTGNLLPVDQVLQFAERHRSEFLVVIDEAYVEFSGQASLCSEVCRNENLVVLRTLSKAYALAGSRCGALIGAAELVRISSALLSPYAFSAPVTELILDAVQRPNLQAAQQQIDATIVERERLMRKLQQSPATTAVWESKANFILARFAHPAAVQRSLASRQILIRQFADDTELRNCARITVGRSADTDHLMQALADSEDGAL